MDMWQSWKSPRTFIHKKKKWWTINNSKELQTGSHLTKANPIQLNNFHWRASFPFHLSHVSIRHDTWGHVGQIAFAKIINKCRSHTVQPWESGVFNFCPGVFQDREYPQIKLKKTLIVLNITRGVDKVIPGTVWPFQHRPLIWPFLLLILLISGIELASKLPVWCFQDLSLALISPHDC